jgi:hypothetical protein
MRILMVGLDAAGKTTILYKLKLGEGEQIGFAARSCWILALWTLLTLFYVLLHHQSAHSSCHHDPDDWIQRGDC